MKSNSVSFEGVLRVEFLPKAPKLESGEENDALPDWAVALSYARLPGEGEDALAVGCYDGVVRVYDPESMSIAAAIEAHKSAIRSVALFGPMAVVASGGHDHLLKLHRFDAGESTLVTTHVCGGGGGVVEVVKFSKGGLLACGDFGGGVRLYDVAKGLGEDGDQGGVQADSKKRKVGDRAEGGFSAGVR